MQGNGIGIIKIHPSELNDNYIDIDSELKGIGSCNFIEPRYRINHNPKHIEFLNLYEKKDITPIHTQSYYQTERPFYT